MTDSNCAQHCPYADEKEDCHGDCMTIKPIETLTDEQLERGKGASLTIQGDE